MPATAQELQARLDQLNALLANGIKSTGSGDKRAEFRSVEELLQAIGAVQGQLNQLQGTVTRRSYFIVADKDL